MPASERSGASVITNKSTATKDPGGWASHYAVDEGPTVAGRSVLIVSRSSDVLQTVALSATTGLAHWSAPTTLSAIPRAELDAPVSVDGVALVLAPVVKYFGGLGAEIEGINVRTGAISWSEHGAFLVADAPELCPGTWRTSAFCLVLSTAPNSPPVFVALAASTGRVEAKLADIARRLAPSLFETADEPLSLIQLGLPRGISWAASIGRAFSSNQYSANDGWHIGQFGNVDLVSLGHESSNGRDRLSSAETVGISQATGQVLWRDTGSFECGGAVGLLGPYLCFEKGTLSGTSTTKVPSLTGTSVVLAGLNPSNGKITWRFRVGDPNAFIAGDGVALATSDVLVLPNDSDALRSLDIVTGAVGSARKDRPLWCRYVRTFSDTTVANDPQVRAAADAYLPCTAERRLMGDSPSTPPPSAVASSGYFVWNSDSGLEGLHLTASSG